MLDTSRTKEILLQQPVTYWLLIALDAKMAYVRTVLVGVGVALCYGSAHGGHRPALILPTSYPDTSYPDTSYLDTCSFPLNLTGLQCQDMDRNGTGTPFSVCLFFTGVQKRACAMPKSDVVVNLSTQHAFRTQQHDHAQCP